MKTILEIMEKYPEASFFSTDRMAKILHSAPAGRKLKDSLDVKYHLSEEERESNFEENDENEDEG